MISDIKIIRYAIGFLISEILEIEDLLAEGKGIHDNPELVEVTK